MEIIKTQNLTFTYPGAERFALSNISLTIKKGEFVTVCGKSGCGKSTLLRQLKPIISPHGEKEGSVLFEGKEISALTAGEQAEKIGFVMQSPDNQIVTDKVWHELAFGPQNLGWPAEEIRVKVAEMASYFGIGDWFYKDIKELSGGQKQILNLAAVMVMHPEILLLDEPTSQLDPVAAQNFLEMIGKINREMGTTVILTEHRLEEAFAMSDRVVVMEEGKIIADESPREVGRIIKQNDMFIALPTPVRVFHAVGGEEPCPITVREGRKWLEKTDKQIKINKNLSLEEIKSAGESAVSLKNVRFRYEKNSPDVLNGVSLDVKKGEFYALVGGNGTGKTTLLSVICNLLRPYGGKVYKNGKIAMLPQNPQTLFTAKTVALDLAQITKEYGEISEICDIKKLFGRHPYDLSGGEQQRAALAKVLLTKPDILLLDEPTKGLDAHFKTRFAEIIKKLTQKGITVIMVSHDIEFCAKYADRCGMIFDGMIVSEDTPKKFFAGKNFYTTAANRMAGSIIPNAVLAEDIITACGGKLEAVKESMEQQNNILQGKPELKKKQKLSVKNIVCGIIFAVLFLLLLSVPTEKIGTWAETITIVLQFIFLGISLTNLLPQKKLHLTPTGERKHKGKLNTILAAVVVLIAVPVTIYFGNKFFGERKYFFTSILIILEIMLPFIISFENRKPKARDIVLISVICAIAVAGREAFFMLPQFKPVLAIVIISGVCFGGETGFLVGAMVAFISNFFFGQGPWTSWQMFATGTTGFVSAIVFKNKVIPMTKGALCLFGGVATLVIYGGILNPASVLMWQANPSISMLAASYVAGVPFDITHAASTVFFLWVISEPMIEKIERVKTKYNLMK